MRRAVGALLVLAAGASAAPAAATAASADVLVTATGRSSLPHTARHVTALAPGLDVFAVTTPRRTTARAFAAELRRRPGIAAAQPNWTLHRAAGLFNVCVDRPSQPQETVAATTGAGVIPAPPSTAPIAVLDTGVEAGIPALAGRVLATSDVTTGGDAPGDGDGHGSQVAAVAAGGSELFRGVSPTSPVIPVRIYNRNGDTTAAWVVKAIQAAVRRGAKVINISGSNPRADLTADDVEVVEQAIAAAFAQGVITVVASGNEGKGDPTVPGSLPHVLNVGSATADGQRDSFSNFGRYVDLVAPGAELIVPVGENVCPSGFGRANGTSFSAPAVAGAAALISTAQPKLSTQQLFDILRESSARDVGASGRDDDTGFGLLDVGSGINTKPPANEPRELNDDVFWLKGVYAKRHPPLVKRSRYSRLKARLSAMKDPTDVYPVDLKKGERLVVSVSSASPTAYADIGIWSSRTGSFDIGAGRDATLVAEPGGVTTTPRVSYRARRAARVYVSVGAPDVPVENDPEATPDFQPDLEFAYTLTLRRLKAR